MASSSLSVRRRNVTFTNRPPQIVRYSYHAGPDASTSLTFGTSSAVGRYPPMSSESVYQNTNDTSSSVSSSPPIYDNVPAGNNPPVPSNHHHHISGISTTPNTTMNNNNTFKQPFRDIPPRKLPNSVVPRRISTASIGHRWAPEEGIEKVDVIQRNSSGVTHVNIGDKNNFYANEDDDDEG